MRPTHIVNATLKVIEDNLEEELTLEILEKQVGYSRFYLHRLFKEMLGETPTSYISRRKLHGAALELIRTEDTILSIAAQYGYQSHENFSRAFKKLFGQTPKEFRIRKRQHLENNTPDVTRFPNLVAIAGQEPAIVQMQNQEVAGIRVKAMADFDAELLWQQLLFFDERWASGMSLGITELESTRHGKTVMHYTAAHAIGATRPPAELERFTLPGGLFARFIHSSSPESVAATYFYIFEQWLPHNGCFTMREAPQFERYTPGYRGCELIEVFIPVAPA